MKTLLSFIVPIFLANIAALLLLRRAVKPRAAMTSLVLAIALALGLSVQPASAATLDIGAATSSNWTVSGGGALNAVPYVVTGSFGRGQGLPAVTLTGISVTSTSETNGTFVAGGSYSQFAGFWTADYHFVLPANAANITLSFANLYCDDRVVLTLNGTPIGATGIIAGHNNPTGGPAGDMEFTDGGALQPYTFSGPDGSVSGGATSGFIVGGDNVLEAIANNTNTGIYGTNQPLSAGLHGQAFFAMTGNISYTVPEPTALGLFALGLAILCKIKCKWGGRVRSAVLTGALRDLRVTLRVAFPNRSVKRDSLRVYG